MEHSNLAMCNSTGLLGKQKVLGVHIINVWSLCFHIQLRYHI